MDRLYRLSFIPCLALAALSCTEAPSPPPPKLWSEHPEITDRMREHLLLNIPASPIKLRILMNHEDPEVRLRVARNPGSGKEILAEMSDDPAPEVRVEVASHPNLHKLQAIDYLRDPHPEVVASAARNPNLPCPSLLKALKAGHVNPLDAAHHPELDNATQKWLMKYLESPGRIALGSNPSLNLEYAMEMTRDPDVAVRESLAQNLFIPKEVLEVLQQDQSTRVRDLAGKTYKELDSLLGILKD